MRLKENSFLWGYVLLVLFDLACGFEATSSLRVISKPLLLLSLLFYFLNKAKSNRNRTFYLMTGALFCSLLGDVFLLFEDRSSIFFPLGLAAFLIAHLLFALTFTKKWNRKASKKIWWIILLLFSYGGFLFYILKDNLGALQIPVILYILGILTMVITAYRRKENVPKSSFNLVFIGALFFVLSDSVLAVNKFLFTIPLSHIIIMGTYATAQYLITMGVLKQGDFGN
ncbi:lysoplasmalogenase [Maribacter sp. 2308TA10-17]|uniref:lysoplasmalogenase n=1 Tax=Maribacter sp. 2308TA10-17 TaxID=3386276 RepID=UPI0039BD44BF